MLETPYVVSYNWMDRVGGVSAGRFRGLVGSSVVLRSKALSPLRSASAVQIPKTLGREMLETPFIVSYNWMDRVGSVCAGRFRALVGPSGVLRSKAPSPLRSAGAVQDAIMRSVVYFVEGRLLRMGIDQRRLTSASTMGELFGGIFLRENFLHEARASG
jgi:hypothetical protein